MTIDLDTLRKTAEAATPGPWEASAEYDTEGRRVYTVSPEGNPEDNVCQLAPDLNGSANVEHIATFDPPTVLALIAEIESLRTRFSAMRAGRDSERSRADKNANALERMEQRALGAEANIEAALEVSRARLTNIEQAERRAAHAVADYEAAEQAVARVRESWDEYKSKLGAQIPEYYRRNIDGALTGHWITAGGTPTGEFADVCSCGKSYWPCTALDGDGRG